MAYELNWSLLGPPPDVAAAINAGYQAGRERRMQGMQDSAFASLAKNPNDPTGLAQLTAAGRPDLAHQMREWGDEERRRDYARAAFGGGPLPGATAPAAFPSSAAPVATPGAPPSAFAPVSAPPAAGPAPAAVGQPPAPAASPAASQAFGQLNPQLIRRYFAEDPEGAQQLVAAWNSMSTAQRAAETQRFVAAEPVLATAARRPYAERRAIIAQSAPELLAHGWTQQELDSFDPTDANVELLLRHAMPIAEQHSFFAPLEGAPGAVYRDPMSLSVTAANPTQPRDETYYDAQGNQVIATVPGSPAIGPGRELFGAVQPQNMPGRLPQPGDVVNGHRYRGPAPSGPNDPALRQQSNWEPVAQGGAGQPQAQGTFPQ